MAGIGLARRRWAPSTAPSIDSSHPLAQGLHALVLPGFSQLELVRQVLPDLITPEVTRSAMSRGDSGTYANSTTKGAAIWGIGTVPYLPPPFTFFIDCKWSEVGTALIGSGNSTAAGRGWRFGGLNGTDSRYTHCGVVDYDNTSVMSGGVDTAIVGTLNAVSGTFQLYTQAVRVVSRTVGSISTSSQTDGLAVSGFRHSSSFILEPANTPISIVALWNRVIGSSEIAALYADPFCMLRG